MDKVILTIAGSDTWGGGGIATDIKTIESDGLFAVTVITSIAVEDDENSFMIHSISPQLVKKQLITIDNNYDLSAIKIGLINDIETINIVKNFLKTKTCPIVIDPVMAFKETTKEISEIRIELLELLKLSTLCTPNLSELAILVQQKWENLNNLDALKNAARELYELIGQPVLVTGGGRFPGPMSVDLFYDGKAFQVFELEKLATKTIHGAGCALSSMIAAKLAQNIDMIHSIHLAKGFVYEGLKNGIALHKNSGGNVWNRREVKNEK